MKKIIVSLLLFCAPAWAGEANMEYAPSEEWVSVNEVAVTSRKIPELEKRIEALEKRVNDLPRVTLPDDGQGWILVPN